MVQIKYGDRVKLTNYPPEVRATVIKQCSRHPKFAWVEIDGREEPVRVEVRYVRVIQEKENNGEAQTETDHRG